MSISKDVLSLIEQFENIFDSYNQGLKKNFDEITQNVSIIYKNMKIEQESIKKLEETIHIQNSELTGLNTKSSELDGKIKELKTKKEELNTKLIDLKATLERNINDLKKPEFELDSLVSSLKSVNDKIQEKENNKNHLDQNKLDNEKKEKELQTNYSEQKMAELEVRLQDIKQKSFFSSFLMDHSDAEIPEVDILANILNLKGKTNMDALKKGLDIPPIMATRTIKQLAVKGIINLDGDNIQLL